MDNMYSTPGGGPEWRTQPYGLGSDGLPETPAAGQPPDQGTPRPVRGRPARLTRWAAGLGIAALLAAGGSLAGVQLAGAGGRPAKAGTAPASGSHAAAPTQAGALSVMLGAPAALSAMVVSGSPAGQSGPAGAAGALHRCAAAVRHLRATGHRTAARATLRSCAGRFFRLRLLLGALHGQITFKARQGVRTIAFERGVIQSASGGAVIVKAADGTTWTWDLTGNTVVIQARHRVGTSALAANERVFVAGPVVSGANDARLILIRR